MQELKLQKDITAQVIINIDEAKVVLEECKVFANSQDDTQIVFQAQDPANANRTIQVTFTKSAISPGS